MELFEAIKGRRSVRSYLDKPVEEHKISKILEAANAAPSAANYRPWYFIVVKDSEKKKKFARYFQNDVARYGRTLSPAWQERLKGFSTEFVLAAPVLIVACADREKIAPGEPGRGQHVLSTAVAIENLMLAAHAEGLGTVWITRYRNSDLRSLFGIPPGVAPLGVLPVGYPAQNPEKSAFALAGWVPDEPLHEHVFMETWGTR